jgi:uncharacterized protein YndB with AHSA1/START domain
VSDTDDPVGAEAAAQDLDAVLTRVAGRWTLTMTSELRHLADRVWPMLTEPGRLAIWSPVVPDRSLTSLGPATSHETPEQPAVDAEVTVSDPPRELVHRWGGDRLRWTLVPVPDGCLLTLEQTFDARAEAGMYAAGWHLCLSVLAAALDGHDVERIVGTRALDHGWQGLRERYDALFGEGGGEAPISPCTSTGRRAGQSAFRKVSE